MSDKEDDEKTSIIARPPAGPWKPPAGDRPPLFGAPPLPAGAKPPPTPPKMPEPPKLDIKVTEPAKVEPQKTLGSAPLELALPSSIEIPSGPSPKELQDRLKQAEEEIERLRVEKEKEAPSPKSLMEDVDVENKMEEPLESLAPALPVPADPNAKPARELALSLVDVAKSYFKGNLEVKVLDGIDLEVREGSFEALMGPSGSGKSTLLHLIAGLDRPTAGSIRVAGADLGSMSEEQLAHWRARTIGFIFQHYNLLPALTAVQNVELPLLLRKELSRAERRERAERALRVVGLEDRLQYKPRELSGGQEQRVAIARAIVTDPKILICDEPTGDLDRKSADAVLELLLRLNRDFTKTIFMVTHDPEAASRATTKRVLSKGRLA